MFDIRTALQFADAVGMPRAALLPLVFADPGAGLAAGTEDGMGMELSRRDFGGLVAAAGLAAVVPSVSVPRGVSSSHVRYWRACTDVLYARDRAVGGTVLLSSALQQWQRVRLAVRDGAAGETGRQLLAAAGRAGAVHRLDRAGWRGTCRWRGPCMRRRASWLLAPGTWCWPCTC